MNNAVHRLDAPRRARKGMASTTVDFSKPKKKRANGPMSFSRRKTRRVLAQFQGLFLETKIAGGKVLRYLLSIRKE